MRKLYSLLATLVVALTSFGQTSVPISLTSGTYSQDFNSLAVSGTSGITPAGWGFLESGTNTNTFYTAGTGSGNAGDTYSFGAAGSPERAFGGLLSGSLTPTVGAAFVNKTGATLTTFTISFTGEQWRLGATGRTDRLDFQYSTDATSLSTGTWINKDELDFSAPVSAGTVGAKDGNDPAFRSSVSFTLTGFSIPADATFFIRWTDFNASGADDGLAIDDFSLSLGNNNADVTAPSLLTTIPVIGATDVPLAATATLTFDENIAKGSGNIYVKKASDNSTVQTVSVASAGVTVGGTTATFSLANLATNTTYYILVENGVFKDLANNSFPGISDATTWRFTTGNTLLSADFSTCNGALSNGFTQFSESGAVVWACTPFGRDPQAPTGTAQAPYGVQINGFSGGSNVQNRDWLISPAFDLTGTTFPLLSFWSRTAFNGLPLQLKISTDYPGTGDPRNYTWADLNGRFPQQASNSWTLSSGINLAAFKQANVHVAFVYTSTDEDGARWTVDDISLVNSETPPPPSLTVGTGNLQFGYVANGNTADKTFSFTGNDLVENVTVTANGPFLLSKDGSSFSPAVEFTVAEANNVSATVYVRFTPTQADQNFTGSITVNTSSQQQTLTLSGTSIDPATTLEVVNWNMEWFGSTTLGPTNDNQQEQNAQTVLKGIGADIFGLVEVVDESRLARVVSNMPGYSYVIGQYGSHVNPPDPAGGPLSEAQKLAFVYRTDLFSNVTTRPLINNQDISSTSYNNWSSGRYPFLLTADVTLNGVTRKVNFVLVHAKANTSPTATSYARRQAAAAELHDTLNTSFANANVVVLGDFNDDLDQSITAGFTTSSYNSFTTDPAHFFSPTLALSLAGKKSTVSYNDMIDHVMLSNEMQAYYLPGTAAVLSDVASQISSYASTTSDHFPVFTRYMFCKLTCPADITVANDPDHCGAVVNFSVGTTMTCGTVTATPASGSYFPVGTTVVNVTSSNGEICSFKVTVKDRQLPVFACPPNIVANPTSLDGAAVRFEAPLVTDNCENSVIHQTGGLPSGSVFPIGTTTNTFEVTDASGNSTTCSFTVTVRNPYCDNNKADRKVFVCHNGNTICVSVHSLAAFLNKGAKLGQCDWYTATVAAPRNSPQAVETGGQLKFHAYPNPVAKTASLQYTLPQAANVSIKVFDLMGREAARVFTGDRVAGTYSIHYNTAPLKPGVYYCRIVATAQGKEYVQIQKLVKTE
ncbi:T9SS-dependent choice-of-anchor J family protein [Flavisolibacter nicotianae]|uniref:T9SS-dependent choice-of-anchor J family protein n=1 Tax=Flavisolibacter nicotianae TaxID=2364882 RepID=UPI000EB25565|nr:choice-of-anchor J domain-containing protein [Flavisolibacter nicotianae]